MPPPSFTGQNNVLESLIVESSGSAKNPVILGVPSKFTCGDGLYAEAAVGVGETWFPFPTVGSSRSVDSNSRCGCWSIRWGAEVVRS